MTVDNFNLDSVLTKTPIEKIKKRDDIVRYIRNFAYNEGFIELETPPFQRKYGSVECAYSLILNGINNMYEINNDFRLDKVDKTHLPYPKLFYIYSSSIDNKSFIDFAERFIKDLVYNVNGGYELDYNGNLINFKRKFKKVTINQMNTRRDNNYIQPTFVVNKNPTGVHTEVYIGNLEVGDARSIKIPLTNGMGAINVYMAGFGVDRLSMLLTDSSDINEVTQFPIIEADIENLLLSNKVSYEELRNVRKRIKLNETQ